ncbi:hypothetical protein [Synechococcus sp. HK01-R]|uniref:hypothetical protein n=1 Tax=Synechococcus sp. HK01-R TaxID=2751171 RepID=UPI001625B738|nr:hypothetical protein [Synechococcus sp. HK01-R]QNG26098.1 hypothetical protein H0O21_07205 [Synechococcus sp. HK01-R]
MNIFTLTAGLVLRGYQKKDPGDLGTYVPPAGGRYWSILPAAVSCDGKHRLWVYPDGSDIKISVCAVFSGTVKKCSINIGSTPVVVRFSPVPENLDGLLDGLDRVAAICNQGGDALLDDALLAQHLKSNLPDWLQVDEAAEVD